MTELSIHRVKKVLKNERKLSKPLGKVTEICIITEDGESFTLHLFHQNPIEFVDHKTQEELWENTLNSIKEGKLLAKEREEQINPPPSKEFMSSRRRSIEQM
jgi:hypothetical protein